MTNKYKYLFMNSFAKLYMIKPIHFFFIRTNLFRYIIIFSLRKVIQFLAMFLNSLIKFHHLFNKIFMGFCRTTHYVKVFPCCNSLMVVFIVKGETTKDYAPL